MDSELALHNDPDPWPDGLGEPGEFRLHDACSECGCSGVSSAVRFVPVWADGSGVLTEEEIEEILVRAHVQMEDLARRQAEDTLPHMERKLPEDVVMHIEGHRDGSFRAWVIAQGGNWGQKRTRYGAGSVYTGAYGWRKGLALSRHVQEITTPQDLEDNLLVFDGPPGVLNFVKRNQYTPSTPEAAAAYRLAKAQRDRVSPDTSWERHQRALRARAAEAAAAADPEGGGEASASPPG